MNLRIFKTKLNNLKKNTGHETADGIGSNGICNFTWQYCERSQWNTTDANRSGMPSLLVLMGLGITPFYQSNGSAKDIIIYNNQGPFKDF
jgi:hypothetical protein